MNAKFALNGLTIQTERILLRPFCQADLEDFYEYASQKGTGERAGWAHHTCIEDSQCILNNFIAEDKTFAIVYKHNNKVIGSIGIDEYGMESKLTEFDGLLGREIGFVLSRDYWGKGLMTEAVKAVIEHLFNVEKLDFLTCGYYDFNVQSKRVQQKCGFEPYRNRKWMKKLEPCNNCKLFRYCEGGGMHLRREDGALMLCHHNKLKTDNG